MKSLFVIIAALLSIVYLINPTAGILEFIPDNIPFIGNIDEAAAVTVLLACARYFGLDLSKFFGRKGDSDEDKKRVVDVD